MSDFSPGFASRHQAAADALHAAFSPPPGFSEYDITERARGGRSAPPAPAAPKSFSPEAPGPRHFSPADREANPTEGWDPLRPEDQGGFIDPIEAARQAGFADGMAAALKEMGEAKARDEALMAQLAEALQQGVQLDRDRIARHLRATVMLLVTRLVGESGVAPDLLLKRIEAAVDMLADSAESAVLRMNPADVPLVEGRLPRTLFPVGDEQVARGGFVLESASTIVEDGPDQWLEQLAGAIDRVAVPPLC